MNKVRIDYGPGRHRITCGTTIYFFEPSGNRRETFGRYAAYRKDSDRRVTSAPEQIGPAVSYCSQELNQSFVSVYT